MKPSIKIAAAIGDPGRVGMLYTLLDGHARTSTELAIVASVSASTASVHLSRLKEESLVKVVSQGKHRYYTLNGTDVASVLESLSVLAGGSRESSYRARPAAFAPHEPVMTTSPALSVSRFTTVLPRCAG